MRLSDFNFELPREAIAQFPCKKRSDSRLMILDRRSQSMVHRRFNSIDQWINPGDGLVINNARVIPAKIRVSKPSGGKAELLCIRPYDPEKYRCTFPGNGKDSADIWECMIKSRGKIQRGLRLSADGLMEAEVLDRTEMGWIVKVTSVFPFLEVLRKIGEMPLPPYIKRKGRESERIMDRERYQTIFAEREGAIAAPTAGLHFTWDLIMRLRKKGVEIISISLLVGVGTFIPVKASVIENHRMSPEYFEVSEEAVRRINRLKSRGGRLICVGTTTVRALEFSSDEQGRIHPQQGCADLFIYPGYNFKVVDALITNFHLPCSTLIMLVSAFAGRDFILRAYREAIQEGYRFFSYGDAMLIL